MKRMLLSILSVMMLAIVTVSATYAYYQSSVNGTANSVGSASDEFDVIYTGGNQLSGQLQITNSRSEDFKTTVSIKMAPNSALAKANIYIKISEISSVLASDKLVWEVVGEHDGEEITLTPNSGDFTTCTHSDGTTGTCTSGDKLYIVTDYDLDYDDTDFTIYIWINGTKVTNDVIGARFSASVGAETLNLSGSLSAA